MRARGWRPVCRNGAFAVGAVCPHLGVGIGFGTGSVEQAKW